MNRFADEKAKVNTNMENTRRDVNRKMDKLANDTEKRLMTKLSNSIDKIITSESKKLKEEMQNRIDDVRDDLAEDVKCLQEQIDEISSKRNESQELSDKALNFCLRNHPQTDRENVNNIVSDLLRDGLKLRDVSFKKAIRKDRDDHKPGVIIVTCKRPEDMTEIMRNKKLLKSSRNYEKVYIHADQSTETRVSNIRMLIHMYQLLESLVYD